MIRLLSSNARKVALEEGLAHHLSTSPFVHAEPTTPKPRPGGRSARVRKAVLDATLSRLLANAFAGLTVADVAADAGVAETTVYRRWPTKSALTAAALAELAAADNPTPDTGTLE